MVYNAPTSTSDGINITGGGSVTLSPQTSGTYIGMTIFQDRTSQAPINMTGGGGLNLVGTIYAAKAKLSITGAGGLSGQGDASHVIGSQVILADLNLTGNGGFRVDATYNTPISILEPGRRHRQTPISRSPATFRRVLPGSLL